MARAAKTECGVCGESVEDQKTKIIALLIS